MGRAGRARRRRVWQNTGFTSRHGRDEGARMIDTSTSFSEARRMRSQFVDDMKTKITCKNGELVVHRSQDCTPYLEENKRAFNEAPSWRPYAQTRQRRSPLRKLAEIPNIVAEQWMREGVNIFSPDPAMQKRIREKLDSNEYQHLRTFPGRMGVRRQWV
jgi:hypothetical protein